MNCFLLFVDNSLGGVVAAEVAAGMVEVDCLVVELKTKFVVDTDAVEAEGEGQIPANRPLELHPVVAESAAAAVAEWRYWYPFESCHIGRRFRGPWNCGEGRACCSF